MTTLMLLQSAAGPASHVVPDGHISGGALAFMIVSWVCVLGLMTWAFATIIRAQDRRAHTPPSAGEPMSPDERVPFTA